MRADLTAAFGSEAHAETAMAEFVPCFARQSQADDPTATIPGREHPEPIPGDPIDDAFVSAVHTASKLNFTQAMQQAALVDLGAVLVTLVLVFGLPREKRARATL